MSKTKICTKCRKTKPLDDFYKNRNTKDGRASHCKECRKGYQQKRQSEKSEYDKKWYKDHKDDIRERNGHKSMYENRLCTSYLGVVIAERLCRHLFNNVKVMPHNNSGFDIICNRGKKIDVKSASTTFTGKNRNPRWKFHIDYNTIADFFILVAFDNRTDLTPLHLWMIPGKELNENKSKSISPSRIHKWNEWERDIKDAQLCCTEMKASKQNRK